jgi:hypothetical protein
VVDTLSRCSDGPRTVTVAPGTAAPLGSRTVPAIEPVTWASAGNVETLKRRMKEKMIGRYAVDDIKRSLRKRALCSFTILVALK